MTENSSPTFLELLTLLIALWGAGLSTFLGLRELRKERRKVKIFIDFVAQVNRVFLTIVNVGYRPITITNARVFIKGKKLRKRKDIPFLLFLPHPNASINNRLPVKINDGEQLRIQMRYSRQTENEADLKSFSVTKEDLFSITSVEDAEGNIYSTFEK